DEADQQEAQHDTGQPGQSGLPEAHAEAEQKRAVADREHPDLRGTPRPEQRAWPAAPLRGADDVDAVALDRQPARSGLVTHWCLPAAAYVPHHVPPFFPPCARALEYIWFCLPTIAAGDRTVFAASRQYAYRLPRTAELPPAASRDGRWQRCHWPPQREAVHGPRRHRSRTHRQQAARRRTRQTHRD